MFNYDSKEFDAQIISIGSFIDDDQAPRLYQVDCMVLRLNHVALNAYLATKGGIFEGDYESEAEAEKARATREAQRERWERAMRALVGLEDITEGVTFSQIQSEIFGMTWIRRVQG